MAGRLGMNAYVAMKSADYKKLVAAFHRNSLVDVRDVDKWPNVMNGLWSPEQAVAYVDHLFDFCSMEWAAEEGLSTC
jgi:hypothetical protein